MKKMISPFLMTNAIITAAMTVVVVIIAMHLLVATVLVVYTTVMLCLCRKPRPYGRHVSHRSY